VRSGDDDAIVADVVTVVADDKNLRRSNDTERLVSVSVTESNNFDTLAKTSSIRYRALTCADSSGVCGRKPLCSSVHELSTLAITRHHNLGRRAARGSLVDEVEHGRASRSISTGQESTNASRVRHTLDCQSTCASKSAGYCVEEDWTLCSRSSDVAFLCGTAREDESDVTAGCAVCQLVVGVSIVLSLGQLRLLDVLALKLCSILLNGEVSADEVSDGEARASCLYRCGECAGHQQREGKQVLGEDLHLGKIEVNKRRLL
jgi:hypothetical protein